MAVLRVSCIGEERVTTVISFMFHVWFHRYFSSCKYRLQPIGGSCLVACACAGENQSSLTYRLIKLKTNCFSTQLCGCLNGFAGAREMGLVLEWDLT